MTSRTRFVPIMAAAFLAPAAAAQEANPPQRSASEEPEIVVVRVTDRGFRPATVTVGHGTTLRFVQLSGVPHNVEFTRVPRGTRMVPDHVPPVAPAGAGPTTMPPLRFGPYLLGIGDVYEVRVDEHLAGGVYEYRCASHAHRGLVLVLDELSVSAEGTKR